MNRYIVKSTTINKHAKTILIKNELFLKNTHQLLTNMLVFKQLDSHS